MALTECDNNRNGWLLIVCGNGQIRIDAMLRQLPSQVTWGISSFFKRERERERGIEFRGITPDTATSSLYLFMDWPSAGFCGMVTLQSTDHRIQLNSMPTTTTFVFQFDALVFK